MKRFQSFNATASECSLREMQFKVELFLVCNSYLSLQMFLSISTHVHADLYL